MTEPSFADRVDSLNHPLARLVRDLLDRRGRHEHGLVLVDDWENIAQARAAGLEMVGVYTTEEADLARGDLPSAPMYHVAWRTAKKIFEVERASRAFALVRSPRPRSVAEVLSQAGDLVVLDQLALAGNAGAIIRTAAAMGVGGVVLVGEDHDLGDRRLIRSSRGYVFRLPVACCGPEEARQAARASARPISLASPQGDLDVRDWAGRQGERIVVLGSEKQGPSLVWEDLASERVRIPMPGLGESLNVSVAAGILLFARLRCGP